MARRNNGAAAKDGGREINAVCRNIRRYRELRGLEQRELSARLGLSGSAVGNWETGYSKPTLDVILPLCRVLGVSLYELFGVSGAAAGYSPEERRVFAAYQGLNEPHRKAVAALIGMLGEAEKEADAPESCPDLTVLRYFSRQLAAGTGDPTELDDTGEPVYLYSSGLIDRADYVFTVNGDSMEPVYHSGDMVLVRKCGSCAELLPGEVGAFMIGNEAYIKEYQPDGLHSYNKRYPVMRFTEEDKVFLIGSVTGVIDESDLASEKDIRAYSAADGK